MGRDTHACSSPRRGYLNFILGELGNDLLLEESLIATAWWWITVQALFKVITKLQKVTSVFDKTSARKWGEVGLCLVIYIQKDCCEMSFRIYTERKLLNSKNNLSAGVYTFRFRWCNNSEIWFFSHLCPESRVFPPVQSVEPRPAPLDGDPAQQLISASVLVPPPGTATQYLSVCGTGHQCWGTRLWTGSFLKVLSLCWGS